MPSLLSGKSLRRGGSGQFLDLKGAQPQFPPNADTSTGYTIVTDYLYRTTTTNILGNLQFYKGQVYSNQPGMNIQLIGTGTSTVVVLGGSINTSTSTGALIVKGGIGIQNGLWTGDDIHVNGLTIGQGYQGINNIVIYGVANTLTNDLKEGENSIAIGYSTLQGIATTLKTIAIGNHAITSGTNVANSIGIGDSALRLIGSTQTGFVGAITGLLTYNPARITVANHGLSSGTFILIEDVVGTTELNYSTNGNIGYFVDVVDVNSFDLYSDINLNNSVNAVLFASYISGGNVTRPYKLDSNIAIGTNAGASLYDGTQNFFFGNNIAPNLTTGSYNFFAGHEVGINMRQGNANIAIGGDNLVDGRDNQINIGSVFYYDGGGNLELNADTFLGLGSHSNNTGDGGLAVYGGVGISDNLNVGTTLDVQQTGTFHTDLIVDKSLTANGLGNVTLSPQGGNVVIEPGAGGILTISVTGASTIDGADIGTLTPKDGHFVNLFSNNLTVVNTITGSINTATDIQYGTTGSIAIQSSPGKTAFIPIGPADTILVSNGTTATWKNSNSLQSSTSSNTDNIFLHDVTNTNYFLVLTTGTNQYSQLSDTGNLTYNNKGTLTAPSLTITNTATVIGSVYSQDGIVSENNLLYTPRVTISTTAPLNPRVGDFWIDPTYGVELQYVNDGGNKFWIQFTGL